MTKTLFDLLLLSLFLLSMTTIAALRSLAMLVATNAVMIFCVPMLGGPVFSALGYSTNIGHIFFAVLMYGVSLKLLLYGADEAYKSVNNTLFALSIAFGSIFLLEHAHVLSPLFGTRIRIFGAAFIAFWLAQSVYVALLSRTAKYQSILGIAVITILMQALTSAVFFPCAFAGDLPPRLLLEFGLVGWVTKSAVVIISIPFLAFVFLKRLDRPVGAG